MPKILIVDDEPHIRILLEQTLEEMEDDGVELLIEENGLDALDTIKNEMPELVFLDVMMPKMNGLVIYMSAPTSLPLFLSNSCPLAVNIII